MNDLSAAESLRELKERREFDTPTDRSTYRQGQFAESAILAALPQIIAVIEAAESHVHFDRRHQRRISTEPIRDALDALGTALRRVEAEQGRLDDARRAS